VRRLARARALARERRERSAVERDKTEGPVGPRLHHVHPGERVVCPIVLTRAHVGGGERRREHECPVAVALAVVLVFVVSVVRTLVAVVATVVTAAVARKRCR